MKKMNTRNVMTGILWIVLFLIPFRFDIAHLVPYYLFISFALVIWGYRQRNDARLKQRFLRRWERLRAHGPLLNILRTSMTNLLIALTFVVFLQYVVNGSTLLSIVDELGSVTTICLSVILVIISVIAGIADWYDKEHKYDDLAEKC